MRLIKMFEKSSDNRFIYISEDTSHESLQTVAPPRVPEFLTLSVWLAYMT